MDYTDAFNAITKIANEKRKAQDLDDLNLERSGSDVGRIQRFLGGANSPLSQQKKKNKEQAQLRTMLDLMRQDAEYAALWQAVENDVREAQQKADMFQQRVDTAIEQTMLDIQVTLDQAVILPDGRKAFLDKDGVAWTQNNEKIEPAIVAGIDWTGRPMRETYLQQRSRLEKSEDLSWESRVLSTRIGDIYNHIHDENKPPQKDELKTYQKDLISIEAQINQLNKQLDTLVNPQEPKNVSIQSDMTRDNIGTVPVI